MALDFKQFYKHLIFDIDESINTLYTAKQGDTKSRGFYITITQNRVQVPVTTETMTFYAQKPDRTRVYVNAVKDGDKFRIDLTNQVFAVPGTVKCELTLRGANGEKISSKTFKMLIDEQLAEDSIVSKDERGVIDDALTFVTEYVPRIELIDVQLLENYQAAIQNVADDLTQHKLDFIEHLNSNLPHKMKVDGKDYKYGLSQENGFVKFMYEEVI